MNEVWLVESYGYDHGRVLFVCETEELAMEYLNGIAKKKVKEMYDMRIYVMNDEIGVQNYEFKKSQADKWVVEWMGEHSFRSSAGMDIYAVKRYIIREDSPTAEDIKNAY